MKKVILVSCLISVFLLSGCISIGGHGHRDRHDKDDRRWHETQRPHERGQGIPRGHDRWR